ncbi:MAG: hypothetical protein JKY57_01285, partial [Kordiimonadaceae bacterium]|nr:hypothetical protein [Kordiimonadaceae bacterium]
MINLIAKNTLLTLILVTCSVTASIPAKAYPDSFRPDKLWGVNGSFYFSAETGDIKLQKLSQSIANGKCEDLFKAYKEADLTPPFYKYDSIAIRMFSEGTCQQQDLKKATELLTQSLYDSSPSGLSSKVFTPEYYYLAGKYFLENPSELGGPKEAAYMFQLAADTVAVDLFMAVLDDEQGFPYAKERKVFGLSKLESIRTLSNEFLGPRPEPLAPQMA